MPNCIAAVPTAKLARYALATACILLLLMTQACTTSQVQNDQSTTAFTPASGETTATESPDDTGAQDEGTVPTRTLTAEQATLRQARVERAERDNAAWQAFREADPGEWTMDLATERVEFDPTIVIGLRTEGAAMEVSCTPSQKPQVTFIRDDAAHSRTSISITFLDDKGKDHRYIPFLHVEPVWRKEPALERHWGTMVYHMADDSQKIIDGMLLDTITLSRFRFDSGRRRPISERLDDVILDFNTAGFPAVYEILTDYCHRTPEEIQATIVAQELKAPTRTPVPTPTFTPVPDPTWQQEWCEENNNPQLEYQGYWNPATPGENTARLILRCVSGLVFAAIHITKSDGIYPENQTGIALAVRNSDKLTLQEHYPEGWKQTKGQEAEGLLVALPEDAAKAVVNNIHQPKAGSKARLDLLVSFDATPDELPTIESERASHTDLIIALNPNVDEARFNPAETATLQRQIDTLGKPTTPAPTASAPLTVSLVSQALAHDGEHQFTFEIRFTEEFSLSYKTLRDHAFTVAGGTIEKAARTLKGSNAGWEIAVRPDGGDDVIITLPTTTECSEDGAICTEDGRKLSNDLLVKVSGPGQ